MAVAAFVAPRSNTCFQSHVVLGSQLVSQPLVVSHTNRPPATQWFGLVVSAASGAWNRALGSQSARVAPYPMLCPTQEGLIVVKEWPPSEVL